MKAGQLALGFLTLTICMWVANAAGTGTGSTTTTEATTTTTTTAATTTTTTTAASSASTVHRKRFRVSNLRFSVTRRYKIYRNTTASTRRLSRRLARLRNRRLVRVLRRSNNRG
ncbi:protein new-glue 3 [Drosophila serrata]|uniref:protein new-glue 3 n=1 Tax=Drosophila serrata TaxID=7274 RepID=UPI000A1D1257|nr:protein new-glue 3 [Drosophila serrata]KAH8367046.1 hypothetical protein KR200_001059 [Drosophila serrata]